MSIPTDDKPVYRLLTGKDDRAFCERVSEALAQGWRLYGSPAIAWASPAADGALDEGTWPCQALACFCLRHPPAV